MTRKVCSRASLISAWLNAGNSAGSLRTRPSSIWSKPQEIGEEGAHRRLQARRREQPIDLARQAGVIDQLAALGGVEQLGVGRRCSTAGS